MPVEGADWALVRLLDEEAERAVPVGLAEGQLHLGREGRECDRARRRVHVPVAVRLRSRQADVAVRPDGRVCQHQREYARAHPVPAVGRVAIAAVLCRRLPTCDVLLLDLRHVLRGHSSGVPLPRGTLPDDGGADGRDGQLHVRPLLPHRRERDGVHGRIEHLLTKFVELLVFTCRVIFSHRSSPLMLIQ